MELKEEISKLRSLQAIDLELDSLKKKKLEIEGKIKELTKKLQEEEKKVKELREVIEGKEREQKEKEEELRREEEAVKKWEMRLKEIKKHREYQALLMEIHEAKKANAKLEEEILELIGELDTLRSQLENNESTIKELRAQLQSLQKMAEGEGSEISKKILGLEERRNEMTKEINKEVLKRYQWIRERRSGMAMAEAKDGICTGCYVSLPPQVYNEVLKMSKLITCPSCQRILYCRDEEEGG